MTSTSAPARRNGGPSALIIRILIGYLSFDVRHSDGFVQWRIWRLKSKGASGHRGGHSRFVSTGSDFHGNQRQNQRRPAHGADTVLSPVFSVSQWRLLQLFRRRRNNVAQLSKLR